MQQDDPPQNTSCKRKYEEDEELSREQLTQIIEQLTQDNEELLNRSHIRFTIPEATAYPRTHHEESILNRQLIEVANHTALDTEKREADLRREIAQAKEDVQTQHALRLTMEDALRSQVKGLQFGLNTATAETQQARAEAGKTETTLNMITNTLQTVQALIRQESERARFR